MTTLVEARRVEEVDPRIQARRDDVLRARQKRRRRWFAGILLALAVAVGAWFVTRTSLLDVDRIDVTGSTHTADDDVRDASGVVAGDQLLDIDAGTIRARLLGLPWVADATVDVSWRGHVLLHIREREPVAVLADGDGRPVLVDGDGRVLAPSAESDAGLPSVDGLVAVGGIVAGAAGEVLPDPAGDALEVVAALTPSLRSRIEMVTITPDRQIEFRLRPPGRVRFCEATDVEAKVRSLQTMFARVDDRNLEVLDVCNPNQPTVTRAP